MGRVKSLVRLGVVVAARGLVSVFQVGGRLTKGAAELMV